MYDCRYREERRGESPEHQPAGRHPASECDVDCPLGGGLRQRGKRCSWLPLLSFERLSPPSWSEAESSRRRVPRSERRLDVRVDFDVAPRLYSCSGQRPRVSLYGGYQPTPIAVQSDCGAEAVDRVEFQSSLHTTLKLCGRVSRGEAITRVACTLARLPCYASAEMACGWVPPDGGDPLATRRR